MTIPNLYQTLQEQLIIQEVYQATDLKPIKIVLKAFLKLLNSQLSIKDYLNLENQYKIQIDSVEETSNNLLVKKANYNPFTQIITILLYSDTTEKLLKNSKLIKQFEQEVYDEFVHENTHKQQNDKSKIIFKALDPEKDPVGYANHYTEVDAYARQTGYILRQEFPNLSAKEIFDRIKNNEVKSKKALDYINTYKLPNILNKESKRFFHTLYQYLNNEEKEL